MGIKYLIQVCKLLAICFLLMGLWSCNKTEEKTVVPPQELSGVPQIHIQTNNSIEVLSKTQYLNAKIDIDGGENYTDYQLSGQIRSRGNYTFILPKKPYKIKLDKKTELFGLKAEKDWVLLANYLDGSHMLNAISMKIGQLLNMPYTNHMVPVTLKLNGKVMGLYTLTEQIEVQENRVNVGQNGQLLVLDTNFDDPIKFRSNRYNLPVMVKYPQEVDADELKIIQDSFNQWESLVWASNFPDNNFREYVDMDALANYLLVYALTCNEEINHPKSTYLYKTQNGKYTMGPIWDFDWAYSYEQSQKYFINADRPLFWNSNALGTRFFSRFMQDPQLKQLLKTKWKTFKNEKYSELDNYIISYAKTIEKARDKDQQQWKQGAKDFNVEVNQLRDWFRKRALYIDRWLE